MDIVTTKLPYDLAKEICPFVKEQKGNFYLLVNYFSALKSLPKDISKFGADAKCAGAIVVVPPHITCDRFSAKEVLAKLDAYSPQAIYLKSFSHDVLVSFYTTLTDPACKYQSLVSNNHLEITEDCSVSVLYLRPPTVQVHSFGLSIDPSLAIVARLNLREDAFTKDCVYPPCPYLAPPSHFFSVQLNQERDLRGLILYNRPQSLDVVYRIGLPEQSATSAKPALYIVKDPVKDSTAKKLTENNIFVISTENNKFPTIKELLVFPFFFGSILFLFFSLYNIFFKDLHAGRRLLVRRSQRGPNASCSAAQGLQPICHRQEAA